MWVVAHPDGSATAALRQFMEWTEMMSASFRTPVFRIAALLCAASFLVSAYLVYSYMEKQRAATTRAKQTILDQASRAAKEIGDRKSVIQPLVEELAKEMGRTDFDWDEIEGRLRSVYLEQEDAIFEVGVALRPEAPCTPDEMYAPHYGKKGETPTHFSIEQYYDPPYLEWRWYKETIAKGARWIEPYLGGATKELVVGFASPFYCPGVSGQQAQPAGVVRANLSLSDIRARLGELQLGKTGFGFILSREGVFIAHPVSAYTYSLRNVFEREDVQRDPQLREFVIRGLAGNEVLTDYIDPESNQDSWLVLTPVTGTNWSLGAVFYKSEVIDSITKSRQHLIRITIAVVTFLATFAFLVSGAHTGNTWALWLGGSITTAFFMLSGVIAICAIALHMPDNDERLGVKVTGSAGASQFLTANSVKQRRQLVGVEEPIYVPTGVFVQSIEFTTANNVILTGYIWQKYQHSVPKSISRGFVLPEAESAEISKSYDRPFEEGTVIGWYFRATLRQKFNYSVYPLDRQDVWIRIWHEDFDRNVILTPDFASYDYTNPSLLPGLDRTDFVLPGWTIHQTYFSFRENSYNSNFGIDDYVGQLDFPELYFNIGLVRRFVDPFISHIIPLMAIVTMLFAVLVFGTKENSNSAELGFDASTVLSIAAAFFFTILIAHVNLRSSLNSEKVVYLEYFYLIIYVAILSVSINSLLFASRQDSSILKTVIYAKGNLWPKLFYWPVIMGLIFAISVYLFY